MGSSTEVVAAVTLLALVFSLGGLSGLYLAWSQELRMAHWAKRVCEAQLRLTDVVNRGLEKR